MKKVTTLGNESRPRAVAAGPAALRGATGQAAAVAPAVPESSATQLLLLQQLVGCADVNELLARFFRWCAGLGLADGLRYRHVPQGDEVRFGERRHHSVRYALTLEQVDVGTVTLCRRQRYAEAELACLEQALGPLACALRTATAFDELRSQVTRDPLTGLHNRAAMQDSLERELARARRYRDPLTVMMIDIDYFKALNDSLGHLGGDRVLQSVAAALVSSTRQSDLPFRFAGDEFVVLLPATDVGGAQAVAARLRAAVAQIDCGDWCAPAAGEVPTLGVSIGIAAGASDDTPASLLSRADAQLYRAKENGRGTVCVDA